MPQSDDGRRRSSTLTGLGVAALAGLALFGVLAWRTVTVERAAADEALRRFEEIRRGFADAVPVLQVDTAGAVTRRPPPAHAAVSPTRLLVLAYHASGERLVRADVPFWFVRMKGWGAQYALADTGLDLQRLGVTPADLERHGVCLWLDETRANGDRLLMWTE
jgi:hypothetical protein